MSLTASISQETARTEAPVLALVPTAPTPGWAETTGNRGATLPRSACSRDRLFNDFATNLGRLVVESQSVRPSTDLLHTSFELVYALLDDEFPTPQVSPGPERGIAVEWLVSGQSLTLHIVSTSDIRLWAEDASGVELFEYELNSKWTQVTPAVLAAREFLNTLKDGIRRRLRSGT